MAASASPPVAVAATSTTPAAVLQALVAAGRRSNPVVSKAVGYLLRAQNPDGGYPQEKGGSSNAQSTSWAIQGLIVAGRDVGRIRRGSSRSPLGYLETSDRARWERPLFAGRCPDAGLGNGSGADGPGRKATAGRTRQCPSGHRRPWRHRVASRHELRSAATVAGAAPPSASRRHSRRAGRLSRPERGHFGGCSSGFWASSKAEHPPTGGSGRSGTLKQASYALGRCPNRPTPHERCRPTT